MKKKLAIVLIGAGGMGKRWAGVIANHNKTALSAIIDIDSEKADKIASEFGAAAYYSVGSLQKISDASIAVISLPHKFLADAVIKALKTDKHVLVEKPGAVSVKEMSALNKSAVGKKLRFMVAYNHRFHPSLIEANKIVESGYIGKLMFIRAVYGFGGRRGYEKEWRHNRKISGGGELIDQGVHLIDLARWFMGGNKFYTAGLTANAFWKSGVEDNAFLLLKNEKGVIASLHASWTQWNPKFSFEIYGSDGYIRVEGLGKKYGGTEKVFYAKRKNDFSASEEKVVICDTDADKSLSKVLDEFISAIEERRDPRPNGRDALGVLEIVERAYALN